MFCFCFEYFIEAQKEIKEHLREYDATATQLNLPRRIEIITQPITSEQRECELFIE